MPSDVARQWFVPGDGIDRHVIVTDIQRYLGNDATVRPGQGTGENDVGTARHLKQTLRNTYINLGCHGLLDQGLPKPYNSMKRIIDKPRPCPY